MRRFRLVSSGQFDGTRLYDADTGEEIPGCCGARIEIAKDNHFIPRVWLQFLHVDVDLTTDEATIEEAE